MRLIAPTVELIACPENPLEFLEGVARTCYQSFDKAGPGTAERMVKMLINRGHTAMIEHFVMTFRIKTDRGVLAEMTRHRIANFAVESSRYCDYKDAMEFLLPAWMNADFLGEWDYQELSNAYPTMDDWTATAVFIADCIQTEKNYKALRELGWRPEQARQVLNMSLATEIVMTVNPRSLLNFFELRTAKAAHPNMRVIAQMMLEKAREKVPVIFDGVGNGDG